MPVPRMSQLRSGVNVNIILKADQRSGKLTTGQVSEILTRGEHPHGIKVRLANGQVGRVQSLRTSSAPLQNFDVVQESREDKTVGKTWGGRSAIQEDYRRDPVPQEALSLADYVKVSNTSKISSAAQHPVRENTAQTQLENDFPKLDTALIAAILADHDDPKTARDVLASLVEA